MKYKDFNDYELLSYAGEQNEEASEILYRKYDPLIINMAKKLYAIEGNQVGLELSDLIQEGRIGLSFAIQHYDPSNNVTFYTYATTCIQRKIISSLVSMSRLKHRFLNESISLSMPIEYDDRMTVDGLLADNSLNPERLMIDIEEQEELVEFLYKELTDAERQVVELRMNGFKYSEIAEILGIPKKKVDNTVQRIRNKLKKEKK